MSTGICTPHEPLLFPHPFLETRHYPISFSQHFSFFFKQLTGNLRPKMLPCLWTKQLTTKKLNKFSLQTNPSTENSASGVSEAQARGTRPSEAWTHPRINRTSDRADENLLPNPPNPRCSFRCSLLTLQMWCSQNKKIWNFKHKEKKNVLSPIYH